MDYRKPLMEYYTDRRSVGSEPQSFGITWLISRVTVVIISLTGPWSGYFTLFEAALK